MPGLLGTVQSSARAFEAPCLGILIHPLKVSTRVWSLSTYTWPLLVFRCIADVHEYKDMADDNLSKPFAQLSASDHGPLIAVATYIFLIINCLAVFVKTWTRYSTARKLAATDWVMLASLARELYCGKKKIQLMLTESSDIRNRAGRGTDSRCASWTGKKGG